MCGRRRLLCLAVWVLAVFGAGLLAGEGTPNLVANGDFAQSRDGKPEAWAASGNAQKVAQTLTVVSEGGAAYAKLACTRCEAGGGDSHAMLAQVGQVKVEKGKTYAFSCRARADGLGSRSVTVALQDTQGWENCGLRMDLALGRGWREFHRIFVATRSVGPTSRLQFWYNEPGTFYLGAVRIAEAAQGAVEFTDVVPPGESRNLVPDGSFELGASDWTSLGNAVGWGNLAHLHGRVEAGPAPHGEGFLRIPLGGDQTPVLGFDYYQAVMRRELEPLAATRGWIPVEKGQPYTLSCDLRAGVDGTPAVLGVRARDPQGAKSQARDYRQTVTLSREWKRCSFTFKPECGYVFVTVGPSLKEDARVDVDLDAVQLEKGAQATPFVPRRGVEMSITPTAPNGIFVRGENPALRLCARNHGEAAATARFTFAVKDYYDQAVQLLPVVLEVPPGKTVRQDAVLPPDWQGFYRVEATLEAGGKSEPRVVKLAIVPRRSATDSVLGINHAFADPYLIRLSKLAGVTWYRDWSLKWQQLEPKEGEFHWEVADPQVDRVVKEGLSLMALLPPFPSARWNSEAPADLPTTGYPGVRLREAWGPRDPGQLQAFTAAVSARYKDRVQVWEFLNEPIYTDYSLPGKNYANKYKGRLYTVPDYVALLKSAAAGMRKSDPGCKVMAGMGCGPEELSREAVAAGCLEHADLFNLHIYPGGKRPEGYFQPMDGLLAAMDQHGGRKPIWMTEFSYYGEDDLPRRPFFPSSNSWAEERVLASERECAEFTVRFCAVTLARGVERLFIHSGASGSVNNYDLECCLFEYGGVPQKVLPALAVFTELLGPAPRYVAEKAVGTEGWALAFENGKTSLVVLWAADEGVVKPVEVPPGVSAMDFMGREAKSPVRLGPAPAYLTGAAGKAKEILDALRLAPEP